MEAVDFNFEGKSVLLQKKINYKSKREREREREREEGGDSIMVINKVTCSLFS